MKQEGGRWGGGGVRERKGKEAELHWQRERWSGGSRGGGGESAATECSKPRWLRGIDRGEAGFWKVMPRRKPLSLLFHHSSPLLTYSRRRVSTARWESWDCYPFFAFERSFFFQRNTDQSSLCPPRARWETMWVCRYRRRAIIFTPVRRAVGFQSGEGYGLVGDAQDRIMPEGSSCSGFAAAAGKEVTGLSLRVLDFLLETRLLLPCSSSMHMLVWLYRAAKD